MSNEKLNKKSTNKHTHHITFSYQKKGFFEGRTFIFKLKILSKRRLQETRHPGDNEATPKIQSNL